MALRLRKLFANRGQRGFRALTPQEHRECMHALLQLLQVTERHQLWWSNSARAIHVGRRMSGGRAGRCVTAAAAAASAAAAAAAAIAAAAAACEAASIAAAAAAVAIHSAAAAEVAAAAAGPVHLSGRWRHRLRGASLASVAHILAVATWRAPWRAAWRAP